jgi:ABC-type multidrug transport system fused ATPase/permease subunit
MKCFLSTAQVFAVVSVFVPSLIPIVVPIILVIWSITSKYVSISRDMKRIESVGKSPVMVTFSETLSGLPILRSFGKGNLFLQRCISHLDNLNRGHLYLWLSNRWLNFRMIMISACTSGAVCSMVLYEKNHDSVAVGLALVYTLQLTDNLTFLARAYADTQVNFSSVERVEEYTYTKPEKYDGCLDKTVMAALDDSAWPSTGHIDFDSVVLRYPSTDKDVLRGVSFSCPAKKKVGVVGRTGAGKSSLLAALFRTCEPSSGRICIDGQNILELPLQRLREAIAIVPQDPVLFCGTIRFNLDPERLRSDDDIWAVLEKLYLTDVVKASGEGLNMSLVENGANLSLGQRQLLCLARALLRRCKCIVLDEATASVDPHSDAIIQRVIQCEPEFADCTILCVAHRLDTIAFYDYVLVMDEGTAKEFDTPLALLEDPSSIFHEMCVNSGQLDTVRTIAIEAKKKAEATP